MFKFIQPAADVPHALKQSDDKSFDLSHAIASLDNSQLRSQLCLMGINAATIPKRVRWLFLFGVIGWELQRRFVTSLMPQMLLTKIRGDQPQEQLRITKSKPQI